MQSFGIQSRQVIEQFNKLKQYQDIIFAISILGIISVLLFPIPNWLVDVLLTVSIAISVLMLMTVLFINKALEFSSFPTALLLSTMLRLSLNIATTRLILGHGHTGPHAAGHVVEAFGLFVMQGSVVIGFIVFGILTIINFVVITKGSGRIAEVAARFSLDAMPGKQMAIDADLSAGIINEDVARSRRKELEDESTFFGSMDGANKFVRGDAIAGLLIIFINFIGGMLIGIIQKGMSFDTALQTYTLLTIGDGLVSQIPALIISTAAGLLVTKSGIVGSADKAILNQLGNYPRAMGISSGLLLFIGAMPGMPAIPFMLSSIATAWLGYRMIEAKKVSEAEELKQKEIKLAQTQQTKQEAEDSDEKMAEILKMDMIRVEIGYELLPIVNSGRLPEQVKALRKQIAKDLGFVMPSVRIQDNMQLQSNAYTVKVKDMKVGEGILQPTKLLIMSHDNAPIELEGMDVKEPAFGLSAKWVDEHMRQEAVNHGYTIVDPSTVLVTHLTELIKDNITEMLPYSAVQNLLDNLSEEHKKIVADVIPSQISVTMVHRVLQGLLQESISIRDLPTILEAISEMAASSASKNIIKIIEHARVRLTKQICFAYTTNNGYIPIVTLSQIWEKTLIDGLIGDGEEKQLAIPPTKLQEFMLAIGENFDNYAKNGEIPVLLVIPYLRHYVRMIIERFRPSIIVLSQAEIHAKAKLKTIGQI